MTPGAAADLTIEAPSVERLLQDGEIILLVVKPSPWRILLTALPVILPVVLIAGGALLLSRYIEFEAFRPLVLGGCLVLIGAQLVVMSLRWVGMLYVLTNRRVMRIGGILQTDLRDYQLRKIQSVTVLQAAAERMLALGSLSFTADGRAHPELSWETIAQPDAVARDIRAAIGRLP